MKNEKFKNIYLTLHNQFIKTETRLSIATSRVQNMNESILCRENADYLENLDGFELMKEIYEVIFLTLNANYDLNDALFRLVQFMEDQHAEEKHHD